MIQDIYFFIGKGGVGKSSCSAVFALQQSRKGKKVIINSIDPAHNLSDIFEKNLSNKVSSVTSHLFAQETDIDIWVKRYLKNIEREMKTTYKYETSFNLDKYFGTLKYSPGIEEYAILLAIQETLKKNEDKDIIIFDTPPTALTLKFLSLPFSSLLWLEQLSKLRKLIFAKKEIITRISRGRGQEEKEKDSVLSKINSMTLEFMDLVNKFKDENTSHHILVMNADNLSLNESIRIKKQLLNLGIHIDSVILNKYSGEESFLENIKDIFSSSSITTLQKQNEEIIGLDRLGSIKLKL
jgi:arsenite-transporting ATPase